ncbi:MAG TPA: M1 family aminopeptidase [Acidobacteriaceae bacterium]|jgi:aminopeptidase N
MTRRWKLFVAFSISTLMFSVHTASAATSPETGISRALATDRADRVSDLHYRLDLTLAPHAATMPGKEVLRFKLADTGTDLPLDFREGTIQAASLNGKPVAPTLTNGHLVLPAASLLQGANTVEITFASRIAAAGAAITRYDDKEDGSEYLYSLFVPMDASMAFPCFDQPDLKAGFTLSVTAPAQWTVIGNTKATQITPDGNTATTAFPETKPISTYIFAFAAGPWTSVHPTPGQPSVYVRKSQVKRAEPEVPQLQEITARGLAWLADYFQQPFPFPKYDIVLIPGFPFGGMEHAGATFLSEDGVLFRSAPTESDRFRRNILTLHELTHQWFGDLVTMRWFDDLWLKEGFAQYMAYHALDSLEPKSGAWKHFYEDIKPSAYGIDETLGTTPIFQNIPNLKDAKSAYGAIVYQKAPSILKQLEYQLGPESFRNGLRIYLKGHAYGNAQWSDLIDAFHTASGKDVRTWADAWVLRRGMPEVSVTWSCNALGTVDQLTLHQHDVLPDGFVWPMSNEISLHSGEMGQAPLAIQASWNTAEQVVAEAHGKPCPSFVFANAGDHAYGRFLLDTASEKAVRQKILGRTLRSDNTDPLLRSMLWGALWENVHVAHSAPRDYVELALANLPHEDDETLARIQGGHAITAMHSYMTAQGRAPLAPRLERLMADRMLHAPTVGLRIVSFRTLSAAVETSAGRDTLKHVLAGEVTVPGVQLRPLDRWGIVNRLIALGDMNASTIFATEQKRDQTDDGKRSAWAVMAGAPTGEAKTNYFAEYVKAPTDPSAKPEDWLTQSLRSFNSWNQSELTEPYLRRALDQLPEIKRDRKIFYLGSWLGAFLGGQVSPEAQTAVKAWLAQPGIDPDLRLKVIESSDELDRTVLIRHRFPD